MSFECRIGDRMVADIRNPKPFDVDIDFMFSRLRSLRRFSGHPRALTVLEHLRLCGRLAQHSGLTESAVIWAGSHDLHEYALGDIVGPLKHALGDEVMHIERRWDAAIYAALDEPMPSEEDRAVVAAIDRAALSMEWHMCLDRAEVFEWSQPVSLSAVDILVELIGADRVSPVARERASGRPALSLV